MSSQHILIVGSGFAGLGMAIRLKQAGIEEFTLLEQAPGIGGTWRDNHYPGAACDVESHLYSFSFAPNPGWSRMFAPQREILQYLESCADKYGLRPHIRLNTAVTGARFDEPSGRWEVRCSDGSTLRAQAIISGTGGLSRPATPDIPGLGHFEGNVFHSARWDHDAALEGKTVAVIGTGASAVQIVPAIAPKVGRLHLFQRTPPWIVPKEDRDLTPAEQDRFRRRPWIQRFARLRQYWRHELMALGFVVEPRLLKLASKLAVRYLNMSVADPALRAKLTPDYTMGCKRILPSNDYYPALQRENVDLITEGIQEIRAHSIVTRDGVERPVDAIVLATGFQAAEAVSPFEVRGRGGRDLNEVWRDGPEAFLGTTVAGFPNLFLIVGPNTGLGHSSMVFMIESQVEYVLSCLKTLRGRRLKFVDVRPDAQAAYNAELQSKLTGTVWSTGCKSWYRTRTGKNTTLWPSFTFEFRRRTRRFDPAAYELVAEDAPVMVQTRPMDAALH
jgi:cation diffusion facilitator CzcD-associated flavoprotein CzcO